MEYQNRPVEWITTETEKIAKDKENNTARDAALLAGGVGAAAGATHIPHQQLNKTKANLKKFLNQSGKASMYIGAGGALFGQGASMYANNALAKNRNLNNVMPLVNMAAEAKDIRNQGLAQFVSGAGSLAIAKRINPKSINKKLLAAKLGLITGGAAAAAAGAHGLMTEKKASDINIRFGGGREGKDDPNSGWGRAKKA